MRARRAIIRAEQQFSRLIAAHHEMRSAYARLSVKVTIIAVSDSLKVSSRKVAR